MHTQLSQNSPFLLITTKAEAEALLGDGTVIEAKMKMFDGHSKKCQ